ncbi:hypothetical protein TSUD_285610, partial [Trifolium subterraneum]
IYLVAENRLLKIDYGNIGISEPTVEVFFGPAPGQKAEAEIIGLSVSTLSSSVFINIKNRGLFAYLSRGRLLWSLGPTLYQFGYRQGCKKNLTDCHFASVPIANSEGELYCLSVRGRDFRWIQDFSSLDKSFTITPGNNGHLYVTVPTRALVLALDVFSGNILWQGSVGPLSKIDCAPVVDSNVGPFLDCSGFAVYSSQIEMEGKVSHSIGEYTIVSAIRSKSAIFTMLVPATGSIYWSEEYPGQLSTLLSRSDLSQFVVNEEILLTFLAASKVDTPLQCRTIGQKLASSCSQARNKLVNIYSGNERTIEFFLLFESFLLVLLIGLVRFCCTFWAKKKLQDQGLGGFLDKRCSLQLQKKALVKTISELEKKAAEESVDNEVFQKLGTKKQKLKMIHTLSDTSSDSSTERETNMLEVIDSSAKDKGKTPMVEVASNSSNDEYFTNPLDVT